MKTISGFLIALSLVILVQSCAHKAACGNTRKVVKQKTKSLKKNGHFNMM